MLDQVCPALIRCGEKGIADISVIAASVTEETVSEVVRLVKEATNLDLSDADAIAALSDDTIVEINVAIEEHRNKLVLDIAKVISCGKDGSVPMDTSSRSHDPDASWFERYFPYMFELTILSGCSYLLYLIVFSGEETNNEYAFLVLGYILQFMPPIIFKYLGVGSDYRGASSYGGGMSMGMGGSMRGRSPMMRQPMGHMGGSSYGRQSGMGSPPGANQSRKPSSGPLTTAKPSSSGRPR